MAMSAKPAWILGNGGLREDRAGRIGVRAVLFFLGFLRGCDSCDSIMGCDSCDFSWDTNHDFDEI